MAELLPGSLLGLTVQNTNAFEKRLKDLIFQFGLYEDRRNRDIALKYVSHFINEQNEEIRLLKLLQWFKEEFFTWMNSPNCPNCSKPTQAVGNATPTPEEIANSAGRVETFTCRECFPQNNIIVARFPRYNNPVKLLETRTGRCGEWANCFALLCRALGYEIRHVSDWTDHVWVEIFSKKEDRWLHCDPCENSIDNPLLYEAGWGKKLTYVIGVSQDDIQDVTWRYTHSQNHKIVLSRRHLVSEPWLVKTIIRLRQQLQSKLIPARKQVLETRLIKELVEFLSPTKPTNEAELRGRISGSKEWRVARKEIGNINNKNAGFEWDITANMNGNGNENFTLIYNPTEDIYRSFSGKVQAGTKRQGWQNGLVQYSNIFRKEERDWKMVYLARTEFASIGTLSWKFLNKSTSMKIRVFEFSLESTTFHASAAVSLEISTSNGKKISIPDSFYQNGRWKWVSSEFDFTECSWIQLTCRLSGGDGNLAWQHAQLFRQSTLATPQNNPLEFKIAMN